MPEDAPEFCDPAEDCPWRSPREILACFGYAPLPPSELDDRQLPGCLWELLYAAAARRFFICSGPSTATGASPRVHFEKQRLVAQEGRNNRSHKVVKTSNINVNCILPATIDTPQNRAAQPSADFTKWVDPSAIAEVILFLTSDASRAVNGAAVSVYGKV